MALGLCCLQLGCSESSTDDDGSGGTAGSATGGGAGQGGENSGGNGGSSGGDPFVNKTCPLDERVGEFSVFMDEEFTSVVGSVKDGITPTQVRTEVVKVGQCVLSEAPMLGCESACPSGETCGLAGECVPSPSNQDVGTVAITGLEAAVSMSARGLSLSYSSTGMFPHPGFVPGAAVQLSADGGEFASFSLSGVGFEPLVVPEDEIAVNEDEPILIAWEAPIHDAPSEMAIEVNIAQHGNSTARVDCVVPDTGEYEIPAELATRLIEAGFAGFPRVTLTRRTIDATDTDLGCVEFGLVAPILRDVTIDGLVSCSEDTGCPDGQTCRGDLTCE